MKKINIANNIIRNVATSCVNTYDEKYGKVVQCFDKVVKHKKGKVTWFEGYKDDILYIIFEGTHNNAGWEDNFDYQQIKIEGTDIYVHKGFWEDEIGLVIKNILEIVERWFRDIIIGGHSLGGGLCILAAYIIRQKYTNFVSVISEAGPRVADRKFTKAYKSLGIPTILFRYKFDPVTQAPPKVVIGLKEMDKRILGIRYRPSILYYSRVAKLTNLGNKGFVNFFKKFKQSYKELRFVFHHPEDYKKAIFKKYK